MIEKYRLRYLPIFYEDLNSCISYLADVLKNIQAAEKLLDDVESAVLNRLPFADRYQQIYSDKERKYPYYSIPVGNYVIYYVVIKSDSEKIMEVRRFLHKRRNIRKII